MRILRNKKAIASPMGSPVGVASEPAKKKARGRKTRAAVTAPPKAPKDARRSRRIGAKHKETTPAAPASPPTPELLDSPSPTKYLSPIQKIQGILLDSFRKSIRQKTKRCVTFPELDHLKDPSEKTDKDVTETEADRSQTAVDLMVNFERLGIDDFAIDNHRDNSFDAGYFDGGSPPGCGVEETKEEISTPLDESVEIQLNGGTTELLLGLSDYSPARTTQMERGRSDTDSISTDGVPTGATTTTAITTPEPYRRNAAIADNAVLEDIHGKKAKKNVRDDTKERAKKHAIRKHKRPTVFSQLKGKFTRLKAANFLPRIWEFLAMSTPEKFDKHGVSTANWPPFFHGQFTIDGVVDGPTGGGPWPPPSRGRAKRRLVLGLFDESQQLTTEEVMIQAGAQNMAATSDELDIIFAFNADDYRRHVFSREGITRDRPTANIDTDAIERNMHATPSRRTNLNFAAMGGYAIPNSWNKKLREQGRDPLTLGLTAFLQALEDLESSEQDFEKAPANSPAKSSKKNSNKKSKKSNKSVGFSGAKDGDDENSFYCLLHGRNNTHNSDNCHVLKKLAASLDKSKPKSKNKTWTKKANSETSESKKELAAFIAKKAKADSAELLLKDARISS